MRFLAKMNEKWLLSPKVLYFVVNLQYYTLHQFRAAFAREKFKVSNSQYGFMTGLIMFLTFFTNILLGNITDRKNNHRIVLLFLIFITCAIFSLFYLDALMSLTVYVFWAVMFLYLTFNNPKQPLLDKIILDFLANIPGAGLASYGRQRLWGTIAYGVATYISELSIKQKGSKDYNFNALLAYCLITTIASFLSVALLTRGNSNFQQQQTNVPAQAAEEAACSESVEGSANVEASPRQQQMNESSEAEVSENVAESAPRSSYKELLADKEFLFFIIVMFSNGVTRSAMSIYLNIYHREVLGLEPYSLPDSWPIAFRKSIGWLNDSPYTALTVFGISFEIFVMFISSNVANRLGLFMPLLLAQLFSLIRFAAYFYIDPNHEHTYGLSCVFELIKGIYFGLAHMSAVQIATRLAPSRLKATSQMIYQGTFNALGSLVSGLVFGPLFDSKLKGKGGSESKEDKESMFNRFFLMNGAICVVTILVYIYKYGVKDKVLFNRQAEEEKLNAAERREAEEAAAARGRVARVK